MYNTFDIYCQLEFVYTKYVFGDQTSKPSHLYIQEIFYPQNIQTNNAILRKLMEKQSPIKDYNQL